VGSNLSWPNHSGGQYESSISDRPAHIRRILHLQRNQSFQADGNNRAVRGRKKGPRPREAVMATGAMMLLGGTSILLGIKPKYGAAAILGFLAGVSPIMHDFWRAEDPNQRMNDMINFTKNLALMGGAAALMAVEEPWPLSVPVAQPGRIERARKFFRREIAA